MLSLKIDVIKRFFFVGKKIYSFSNMLNQKKIVSGKQNFRRTIRLKGFY